MGKVQVPDSLQEAIIHFADAENCRAFMVRLRWPDGTVRCPQCNSDDVEYLPNARVFKCYQKHPRQKFSLKVGTIFEDSPIGLDKWLPVMWMLANCRNGISSWEIHRAMGVTQKTAWFMLQRARLAMQDDLTGGMLGGDVEVDETFIGGKARNMHKDRKLRVMKGKRGGADAGNKTIVLGILERETEDKPKRVRATVIADRKKATIQPEITAVVAPGTAIHSDEHGDTWRFEEQYVHNIVSHLETYVEGNVHTNTLENFWSLLKRGLAGTYISVEPFHLFRYVDEQAFRFNNRKATDAERFQNVMSQIVGRRLTYQGLIGKMEIGPRQAEEPF
jgi:transposase-like protein